MPGNTLDKLQALATEVRSLEQELGVTLHKLARGLEHGPVATQCVVGTLIENPIAAQDRKLRRKGELGGLRQQIADFGRDRCLEFDPEFTKHPFDLVERTERE